MKTWQFLTLAALLLANVAANGANNEGFQQLRWITWKLDQTGTSAIEVKCK